MSRLRRALSNIAAVAWREFREFISNPILIALSVISPLLMFVLFSYGFSLDVKHIPFSYVDLCRTPASRAYVDSFISSGYFQLVGERFSAEELHRDLQLDRVRFGMIIPEDFSQRLARNSNTEVQLLINGTMASRAVIVKGYVEGMNAQFNRGLIEEFIIKNFGGQSVDLEPIEILTTAWFNPSLDSRNFLVPGVVGFIIFIFPAMMTAIALSREKETGMIFNVYTSPLTKFQYICGKTLLYIGVSLIIFLVLFALTLTLFEVPFRGDFLTLLVLTILFIVCSSGIGLLIASLVRTQVAALLITMIATFLPAFLYSGFFMPVESMGVDAKIMSIILPCTYYFSATRLIFLKGVNWGYLVPQVAGLIVFAVVVYGLTLALFKKRIG